MDDRELRATVARIDERTESILKGVEMHVANFKNHEQSDREDFKEIHARITSVEKKQNWMLGIGTAAVFLGTVLAGFFKGILGGP